MKYEIQDLYRSRVEEKILEYIKIVGAPNNVEYGTTYRGYHKATLTYNDKSPFCNPCYGQSWVCENCIHKEDGQVKYNKLIKDISSKITEDIVNALKDMINDEKNKKMD